MENFKLSNGWSLLGLIIIWQLFSSLFFFIGPYPTIAEQNIGTMPEERIGYSIEELDDWFEALADSGRQLYQRFQLLDLVNAAVTAIVLSVGLAFTLPRLFSLSHAIQAAQRLPSIVFILELVENSLLFINAQNYPAHLAPRLIAIVTVVKIALGFGSILLLFGSAIWILIKHLTKGASSNGKTI